MEESYETFEEELRPTSADPPPQKAVRQIHRPEMYVTRKIREEMPPVSQQQRAEPKTFPREPSIPRTTSMHKTLPIQNPMQIDTPWENVTLNRCLFVAITILVLTSGFQKLHEVLRGQGAAEGEEDGLILRRSGMLRHRGQTLEPETSLWEVMLWWLPDFDDEDDDDGEEKRGRAKKGAMARTSSGLRNKPLPDKKLMKQRDRKLTKRNMRATKTRHEDIKEKEKRNKKKGLEEEEAGDGDEEDEETVPKNNDKRSTAATPSTSRRA
ncbi:junctional sarcoplasmic reticulum protein 1 [Echeneis naucrates]|uniref:junctional sarcoplasmic reticulum protein 1 n=1 Tax=Echeneis naucrates TaxID=173247 RepID=UPI001113F3B0|nr:junctional sarcoplasmic reticulum protein 1-like [Echeneis naucrates]